jgi:hypothetical protein
VQDYIPFPRLKNKQPGGDAPAFPRTLIF